MAEVRGVFEYQVFVLMIEYTVLSVGNDCCQRDGFEQSRWSESCIVKSCVLALRFQKGRD